MTVMKTCSAVENSSRNSNASKKVNISSSPNPVTCLCCGESHSIHKCQKLSSKPVEEKKRFIMDNNLCLGCLRRGHISKECKNNATCGMCKKSHPAPLHEGRSTAADTSSSHVHLFGAASSPGCTNYRMKYLASQSQNEKDYPAAASFIKKNFYVDDGLISVESVDSAIKLVREAQTVCTKGKVTPPQVHLKFWSLFLTVNELME